MPFDSEPTITVGIMDRRPEVRGCLNGKFSVDGSAPLSGDFAAAATGGMVVISDGVSREVCRAPIVRFTGREGATFALRGVTIGLQFHWERGEDQVFRGSLLLRAREDGTLAAVNEIGAEQYLESVVSSEMSARAPVEFLKAHAVLSRSWLLAALERKAGGGREVAPFRPTAEGDGEILRWYERDDHDLYDVCADDHCQRYQGITKILSEGAGEAVRATRGTVLSYGGAVCDARYSKCCGGLTEEFRTAWADISVPYLASITDGPGQSPPAATEDGARRWVLSEPESYCNVRDAAILGGLLPGFDRETKEFFRWRTAYDGGELAGIIREKSGINLGTLEAIVPLRRGPSGRILRLRIVGAKRAVVVGKELEIRRWLSPSHLLSSAFVVTTEQGRGGRGRRFIFNGAGWGHGVGLCQVGAAVMAIRGFTADAILRHYFPAAAVSRAYR